METYSVDLEASQIVRWLIEEQRRGTLQLNVTATRTYVVEALEKADLDQIGEEGEDLNDVLAIGTLEVGPPAGKMAGCSGSVSRTGSVQGCRMTRMRLKGERNSIFRHSKRILSCPSAVQPRSFSKLKTRKPKPDLPGSSITCFSLSISQLNRNKARFTRVFNHMLRNEHRPPR